jgi:hypothetical protein
MYHENEIPTQSTIDPDTHNSTINDSHLAVINLSNVTSLLICSLLAFSCGFAFAADPAPRRVENFNRDWTFAKGAQPGAETAGFDDSAWEAVRLPHDWTIRGPYDPQGEYRTGKLPWRGALRRGPERGQRDLRA